MLQLLQNKTFGNTPLPEDWIIVAAGNPPEYNKSVRELDMVTMDRVKHIDVAADLEVWQRYAVARDIHPVVRTYLSVWPDHFYRITETERGLCFVTARGWEDMSLMLRAMEEDDTPVDSDWCLQYLQDDGIAGNFALYYDLFRHFTKQIQTDVGLYGDFSLAELLMGNPEALASWSSTQCLAAAAMLFHPIQIEARRLAEAGRRLERRAELAALMPRDFSEDSVRAFFDQKREAVAIKHAHDVMMPEDELRERSVLEKLEADVVAWRKLPTEGRDAFSMFEQERLEGERACLRIECKKVASRIEAAYRALEVCPQGRSARLYLTSDLAASEACAALLAEYSSTSFERYRSQIEV
jgi:hypothetical protein